jgi:hypothetical protein
LAGEKLHGFPLVPKLVGGITANPPPAIMIFVFFIHGLTPSFFSGF